MRKLILFATLSEAEATIKLLSAKPCNKEKVFIWSEGMVPSLYSYADGWIALSGFGIHAAQLTVSKYAQNVDEIWNLGFAGSLRGSFPTGSLQQIEVVAKHIPLPLSIDPISRECAESVAPIFSVASQGAKLISSDYPVHDPQQRELLAKKWDLVDMEGYGVAFAAHHLGKKCLMWKVISDLAQGRAPIQRNKKALSTLLAELTIASHV